MSLAFAFDPSDRSISDMDHHHIFQFAMAIVLLNNILRIELTSPTF